MCLKLTYHRLKSPSAINRIIAKAVQGKIRTAIYNDLKMSQYSNQETSHGWGTGLLCLNDEHGPSHYRSTAKNYLYQENNHNFISFIDKGRKLCLQSTLIVEFGEIIGNSEETARQLEVFWKGTDQKKKLCNCVKQTLLRLCIGTYIEIINYI